VSVADDNSGNASSFAGVGLYGVNVSVGVTSGSGLGIRVKSAAGFDI